MATIPVLAILRKNLLDNKYWVPVGRVNNAHGDRNLICSCLPIEEYQEEATI